jgi:hypothetical protein
MVAPRNHSTLLTVPLLRTVALLCPLAYGKVMSVDANGPVDFGNLQAATDAASGKMRNLQQK